MLCRICQWCYLCLEFSLLDSLKNYYFNFFNIYRTVQIIYFFLSFVFSFQGVSSFRPLSFPQVCTMRNACSDLLPCIKSYLWALVAVNFPCIYGFQRFYTLILDHICLLAIHWHFSWILHLDLNGVWCGLFLFFIDFHKILVLYPSNHQNQLCKKIASSNEI